MGHDGIFQAIGAVDGDAIATSDAPLLQAACQAPRRLEEAPVGQHLAFGRDQSRPPWSLGRGLRQHVVQRHLGIGFEAQERAVNDHHAPPDGCGHHSSCLCKVLSCSEGNPLENVGTGIPLRRSACRHGRNEQRRCSPHGIERSACQYCIGGGVSSPFLDVALHLIDPSSQENHPLKELERAERGRDSEAHPWWQTWLFRLRWVCYDITNQGRQSSRVVVGAGWPRRGGNVPCFSTYSCH